MTGIPGAEAVSKYTFCNQCKGWICHIPPGITEPTSAISKIETNLQQPIVIAEMGFFVTRESRNCARKEPERIAFAHKIKMINRKANHAPTALVSPPKNLSSLKTTSYQQISPFVTSHHHLSPYTTDPQKQALYSLCQKKFICPYALGGNVTANRKNETALSGMEEISTCVRRSSATVLYLIRHMDFPAKKIKGMWESDRQLIDDWRQNQIESRSTG